MTPSVTVRVPASSANLGCAFDCAAIALQLYLTLRVGFRDNTNLSIQYRGVTPERVPLDENNLIVRVIRDLLREWKIHRGLELEIDNQIPIGVGLGSSAAAIIGAIVAAHRLAERAAEDEEVLSRAAKWEGGHPDNVAAAWHGGFTVAVQTDHHIQAWSCPVPETVRLALVIPDYPLPTEKARAVLPSHYSRSESVHNLQRAAALAAQFFSGHMHLAPFLFDDRFHQPYRAALIPGLDKVLRLRHPDLEGVCLSGAGPSLLAFVRGNAEEVGGQIVRILEDHSIRSELRVLAPANLGAKDRT